MAGSDGRPGAPACPGREHVRFAAFNHKSHECTKPVIKPALRAATQGPQSTRESNGRLAALASDQGIIGGQQRVDDGPTGGGGGGSVSEVPDDAMPLTGMVLRS
jgi:hypothetical protein